MIYGLRLYTLFITFALGVAVALLAMQLIDRRGQPEPIPAGRTSVPFVAPTPMPEPMQEL